MVRNRMWITFVCCLLLLLLSGCHTTRAQHSTTASQGFCWVREESCFVDYMILGDTIEFRYTLCFENNSNEDVLLSCLNASFRKADLIGWLEYEKSYSGVLESGDTEIIIPAGEKVKAIYVFSGKYLGGTVNENLAIPDIAMIQDYIYE